MIITPMDVRNRQFGSALRGYDPADVREYLDNVARELEKLARERLQLQEQLAAVNERVKRMHARELQVQEVLKSAEMASDERLKAAEEKSQAMVARADVEAEEILRRVRREREALLDDVSELRSQRDRFRAEIKGTLKAFADMVLRTGSADLRDLGDVAQIRESLDSDSPVDISLGGGRSVEDNVADIDLARRQRQQ